MHRIVSIVNGVIKTRGDANNVDDAWQVTLSGTTAYRMGGRRALHWLVDRAASARRS